jgi:uncharacterized protein (TIGR00730 family)
MSAVPPAAGSAAAPGRPDQHPDFYFLAGPHSRLREAQLLWRVLRDLVRGFRALHFGGPCVTVFGSARFGESHPYYPMARDLGARISRLGFTVMTGGGPGLMEAANRGAYDAGGRSIGVNVELPMEQRPNPYLYREVTCHYFFVRKVLLFKYSYAFVGLPGGFGTLDELCEALTLIQTGKIQNFPVVLIGTEYWELFRQQLQQMVAHQAIAASDLNLLKITDDLDEAIRHIEAHTIGLYGLRRVKRARWWLGER